MIPKAEPAVLTTPHQGEHVLRMLSMVSGRNKAPSRLEIFKLEIKCLGVTLNSWD